jgi:hypothetical protein
MERLNLALEALYENTELPDDPGAFIAQQLTSQQELIGDTGTASAFIKQLNRPRSATFKK